MVKGKYIEITPENRKDLFADSLDHCSFKGCLQRTTDGDPPFPDGYNIVQVQYQNGTKNYHANCAIYAKIEFKRPLTKKQKELEEKQKRTPIKND